MSTDPGERAMSRDGVTPSNYIETDEGYWYSPPPLDNEDTSTTTEKEQDDDE